MSVPNRTIHRKLRALGCALLGAEFARRLVVAVVAALALLLVLTLVDGVFELGLDVRKVLLAGASVVVGALLLRALVAPLTCARDAEQLALLAEQHHPEFDSRLISAVQFARGKASGGAGAAAAPAEHPLVAAMVRDTESLARGRDFLVAVDWRGLGRALLALVLVAGAAGCGYALFHDVAPALVQRAFLQDVPIPRDTQITATTGDLKVGVGDEIVVTALAAGELPDEGTLRVRFASGRRLDYVMRKLPGGAAGSYAVTLEDVPESFTYEVRVNDARSDEFRVTALHRPEVKALSVRQVYPDYTAIDPTEHQPGDFYLFPGARATVRLEASKPLGSAQLRLVGLGDEHAFDVASGSAEFEVPTEGLTGFSITLVDSDGMAGRDPAVYRVELLGDEPPDVRITFPTRSEELATRSARSRIAFEASDRFGIGAVRLNFAVNGGDPQAIELEVEPAPGGAPPKALRNQFDWRLGDIEPPIAEGDVIEYWMSAEDLRRSPEAVGESERLRLRVVSAADKRRDLLSRATDFLAGVGATTEDQVRLNDDLGELIKMKAKAKADAGQQ